MKHDKAIFREYDIRGVVGTQLIIEEVYSLVKAVIFYGVQKKTTIRSIMVARDGRTHSYTIEQQVIAAILDSGIEVVRIGVCPSPVLYFGMHTTDCDMGIIITASHNAKEFNGFKICLGKEVIWGSELQVIYSYYLQSREYTSCAKGMVRDYDMTASYVQWLCDAFKHLRSIHLNAVLDCGNGTAGTVLPALLDAMGWQGVTLLYPEVDGTYPNHEADPVVAANMRDVQQYLTRTDAVIGIGFDGDCDRMGAMTKSGLLIPGDLLLALFVEYSITDENPGPVVFDAKSSDALIQVLKNKHRQYVMSPSGHAIIRDRMQQHGACLAGELSCHFFFADRYFGFDDGIYAFMRLVELLHNTNKTLDELVGELPRRYSTHEMRIACAAELKKIIVDTIKHIYQTGANEVTDIITIDGVRVVFPYGWFIVRPSNTQDVISIRGESSTAAGLVMIKNSIRSILAPYYAADVINQYME